MEKNSWKLVNPEGIVPSGESIKDHRPRDLIGKTVLLHWNGKHNGDVFLARTGELLTDRIKDINVIKGWEVAPQTRRVSGSLEQSKLTAQKLASFMPDIVIGATAD